MILLSSIIQRFEAEFLANYQSTLLPSQRKALAAMKQCRTTQSLGLLAQCDGCEKQIFIPHSCGHRNCPHYQHYERQQWQERQLKKQVPVEKPTAIINPSYRYYSIASQPHYLTIKPTLPTIK